ncbi:TolA-binding protein [Sphingobium jiangsuense]|uniref:TolA-binding protein n=1 Tax=Sphingobium jiangsuense TaxID=870476 RepID=A0A7W6FS28_9SPHN|nr:tetratricopeptide repeat protein [Sphingobium jiangsuense]MBB3927629.1 TolA-binding protein [Sphingobium jiangsuense]
MRHTLKNITALASVALIALPALNTAWAADSTPVETRVDRLEKEMRAVQRKVFPAGVPVQPDIVTQPTVSEAVPSSTPVSDLMARVTSLEGQLASITGQVEQNSYKLRQLEERIDKMKTEMTAAPAPALSATQPLAASATAKPAPAPAATAKPAAAAAVAGDTRKTAVAAIEQPSTGNAANDAYTYGYRLWEAKFYPEAQAQLKTTVEKYGSTSVGSRAQNLLGRAYLDDGKPALASVAFYENYQKRPNGDRAAQSLAYLGEALIQLKKPADACKVYKELEDSYGSTLTSDLRSMMEKGRVRAKCAA